MAVVLSGLTFLWGCSEFNSSPPSSEPIQLSIKTPVRLAGGSGEFIFVSDYDKNAVFRMRLSDRELIDKIDVNGKPTGLAWTASEVFVGNESTGNIEVYDSDSGQYLRRLGSADGLFTLPNAIAVDESLGVVFAVDTAAGLIRQFNFDGTSAGPDLGTGLLRNPTALTVDAVNQWLYVSDFGEPVSNFGDTPAIHVIPYGIAVPATLRIEGTTFDFDRPQGLILHSGKLFVAESVAGQVLVFDVADLSSVSKLPSLGSGTLKMPLDVFIDAATADLYITSSLNSEVVVIAGGGA